MILYHIADLHIGKSIYGRSMLEDQRDWVEKFLAKCDEKRPDAVLIAGDVYDRSNPSGEAMELVGNFLSELDDRDIPVFMIAGNHDGGEKVDYLRSILVKQNIHVSGKINREIEHFTMENPDGNGPVTFWLVPYIFPERISSLLDDDSIRTYTDAMKKYLEIQNIDKTHRNVILSHQNVVNNGVEVERGGSETMVGGVGQIEYTVYDDFEYVALGHIHSGFSVGRGEVRYAGTPLCYHFDETKHDKKGYVEVTLGAKGEEVKTELVEIKPLHKMRFIEGSKNNVIKKVEEGVGNGEYVGVVINDMRLTPEIASYLASIVESREGVLLYKDSSYREFSNNGASADRKSVNEKAVEDLFSDFYRSQTGDMIPTDEEYALMHMLGELVRNSDATKENDEKNVDKLLNKLLADDNNSEEGKV